MTRFGAAVAVPARDPATLELAAVVATTLPARFANEVIKLVCAAAPLKDLRHVKRVRKRDGDASNMDVILCALPTRAEGRGANMPAQHGEGDAAVRAHAAHAAHAVALQDGEGGQALPAHAVHAIPGNAQAHRDTQTTSSVATADIASATGGARPAHQRGNPAEAADQGSNPVEAGHLGSKPAEAGHPGSGPGGTGTAAEQPLLEQLPAAIADALHDRGLAAYVAHVPRLPPETREQWAAWCRVWPVTWKVPEASATDTPPPLSAQEQAYFERHVAAALALAKEAGAANAAVVVDPPAAGSGGVGMVVATGVNRLHEHPLHHAAMVAVEAAAERDRQQRSQSGGDGAATAPLAVATAASVCPGTQLIGTDASCGVALVSGPTGRPVASLGAVADGSPPLCAAGKRRRTDVDPSHTNADPSGGQPHHGHGHGQGWDAGAGLRADGLPGQVDVACGHGSGAVHNGPAGSTTCGTLGGAQPADAPGRRPYMCTGYDVFLAREPCVMCAMGLVHSRLARVVYCQRDEKCGALGGRHKLHAYRSLNHHYHVYHLPLADAGELVGANAEQQLL